MRETKLIRSKQNQEIKELKQLGKKGPYKRAFITEGLRMLEPVLASQMELKLAIFSETFANENGSLIEELDQRLDPAVAFRILGDDLFRELADTVSPQGLILVVERRLPADFSVLPEAASMILVLDRVQDPGNVGTLIRTAAALGLDGIISIESTADPYEAKTVRSAMGASLHIPIVTAVTTEQAIDYLRERSFTIWAADMDGQDLAHCSFTAPLALVLGNEGNGLSDKMRAAVDQVVSIPLANTVESLNVAIAGGIIAYQMKRMVQ